MENYESMANRCGDTMPRTLKLDLMAGWIEDKWIPQHPGQELIILWTNSAVVDVSALKRYTPDFPLPEGFCFEEVEPVTCLLIPRISDMDYSGDLNHRSGAYLYRFRNPTTGEMVETLVTMAFSSDEYSFSTVTLVCLPQSFVPVWTVFVKECRRLSSGLEATNEVVVIGGRSNAFKPTVEWEDIILPSDLKTELMEDVQSFFSKGIEVYQRLKLKPFRKLLLAGVPGTGKTMLCSALAKWALAQKYVVIYVSSGDRYGSTFSKIDQALSIAADSSLPSLILLEELDAYLHDEDEKALILNVLDGAESTINDQGTLLVATTNHPEAIDDRVLKRPGRLDRVFIIPEANHPDDAEKMLRQYLGEMWREEHRRIARRLTGYPGAFIREVAVYALTRVAYEDGDELSAEMLQTSFERLQEQIEARDDFLTHRSNFGLVTPLGAVAEVQ
jgi:AAA+ superfamily predicted ATPase